MQSIFSVTRLSFYGRVLVIQNVLQKFVQKFGQCLDYFEKQHILSKKCCG